MTNHERFAEAFRNCAGREFSTGEIKDILLRRYPEMSQGSILPNDHAEGNKSPCWCAGSDHQILERVKRGFYRVRRYA